MQVAKEKRRTKIYNELARHFPLWREACLEEKGRDLKETLFIKQVFKAAGGNIRSVVDLGGGVGTHSKGLVEAGYDVTLFDQSRIAIAIAQRGTPRLATVQGCFESIYLDTGFDAAVCMWSTLAYVHGEKGRKHFYQWLRDHAKDVIILDQANFHAYPRVFHKVYEAENEGYAIKVTRDWVLDAHGCKRTKFVYELFNKRTGAREVIDDEETQKYIPIERLACYLGRGWDLAHLVGDYDLAERYERERSSRMIAVFTK